MRNYVTLFDKNYLAKGLALYQSLEKHSPAPFTLWVLPLDYFTKAYLQYQIGKNVLPHIQLLEIPIEKLKAQYGIPWFYFMMASETTQHVMNMIDAPVTYLDSDIYFFDDPEKIYVPIGSKEVAIIPHRFPSHDFARLSPNGLFNVSFVYFDNTIRSQDTLIWWNQQCRAKCDAETCGDQKYLDTFPELLGDKLCVLENIGIGAGPWNGYTYEVSEGPKVDGQPLVFYHFHEFKNQNMLTGYPVTKNQRFLIYEPYIKITEYCQSHIDKKAKDWNA